MKLKIDSASVPNFSLIQCPGRFDGKNHMRYQIMSSKIIKGLFLDIFSGWPTLFCSTRAFHEVDKNLEMIGY